MKMFFSLAFALMALPTFAGGTGGNGGVSVVCRDQTGSIKSAEILDLYEGREIYGRVYGEETLSVETKIQLAQLKLARFSNYLIRFQDELALAQANTIFVANGNELEATNDALPLIKKRGCAFEQLANYTNDGSVLISQEIYDRLSNNNKAALYVHEAVYAIRRKLGDKDSQKSRRLVAHLMANNGDQAIIKNLVEGSIGSLNFKNGQYCNKARPGVYLTLENLNNGFFKITENTGQNKALTFSLKDAEAKFYAAAEPYYGGTLFLKSLTDMSFIYYVNDLPPSNVEYFTWNKCSQVD